ncbi:MAG TPA: DsbA family protein [Kofleriaceae bacterium]|nr:DsbA family protein [Kofleriaceae bacterium]
MKSSRIAKENGPEAGWTTTFSVGGRLALPVLTALSIGLLGGASCKKKESTAAGDPNGVIAAADAAKQPAGPVDKTPIPGVDVSKLETSKQDRFFQLVASLPSPCGKAHSLRTSVASDATCKRAPFAARLVAELIADEQSDDTVRGYYDQRYTKNTKVYQFKLDGAPVHGSPDAPVTLVEFFDYGCPACVQMKPVIDQVAKENQGKLKVVYKMYPLTSKHPDSLGAAQAAMAAHAQGKFQVMHDLVFDKFGAQKKADLRRYAEQVGLDLARFDLDYGAQEAVVRQDMAEGEANGVDSTPSLYLNGRRYPGPADPKYFAMAIEEELAARQ